MPLEVIGILANLGVEEPIGLPEIAIVDVDSPLVDGSRNTTHYRRLAGRLRDEANRVRRPSFLAVDAQVFPEGQGWEKILAFRNAVAMSSITSACEGALAGKTLHPPIGWSDYFAIYPYTVGTAEDGHLIAVTPVGTNVEHIDEFFPSSDPTLPARVISDRSDYDAAFQDVLLNAWRAGYRRPDQPKQLARLFRSLQIAFFASSVPTQNHGTLHDYGARLGLWASAMEVLVSDGSKNEQQAILAYLGRITTAYPPANIVEVRRNSPPGKPPRPENLLQELQRQIWEVRNDFMHGNAVSIERLFAWGHREGALLTKVAAALYRLLVLEYLDASVLPVIDSDDMGEYRRTAQERRWLWECTEERCSERGLMWALGLSRREQDRSAPQQAT